MDSLKCFEILGILSGFFRDSFGILSGFFWDSFGILLGFFCVFVEDSFGIVEDCCRGFLRILDRFFEMSRDSLTRGVAMMSLSADSQGCSNTAPRSSKDHRGWATGRRAGGGGRVAQASSETPNATP